MFYRKTHVYYKYPYLHVRCPLCMNKFVYKKIDAPDFDIILKQGQAKCIYTCPSCEIPTLETDWYDDETELKKVKRITIL